ncbi:expressed unknown protein [Seminavis robusta]|uniref:Uncharacterized protein n=1 Tax=Seminavis robusta TaxID=568900 RepID=A0A9N8DP39_9STRA|nr:expressed unknown protein [Seminavis robusta]|eukprot:Sro191_g082150.1 n/a (170) ;mRNA; f:26029-26538
MGIIRSRQEDTRTAQMMALIFPELDSKFAQFPMKRGNWLYPIETESDEQGCPAFIPLDKMTEMKEHYVYGSATHKHLGTRQGYYHVLTKEAHMILHHRMQGPLQLQYLCAIDGHKREAWSRTQKILKFRSLCGLADDDHCLFTGNRVQTIQGKSALAALLGASGMSRYA